MLLYLGRTVCVKRKSTHHKSGAVWIDFKVVSGAPIPGGSTIRSHVTHTLKRLNEEPKKFCYFLPHEDHFGICLSIDEAHERAKNRINSDSKNHGTKLTYEVAEACPALVASDSEPRRISIADQIIEQLDLWAGEDFFAEENTFAMSEKDRKALGNLVMDFVLKHADHQWFAQKPGTVSVHTHIGATQTETRADDGQ
ncbi:hypothetical protein GCM10028811_12140 [Uliginosibacterium sediminicola]